MFYPAICPTNTVENLVRHVLFYWTCESGCVDKNSRRELSRPTRRRGHSRLSRLQEFVGFRPKTTCHKKGFSHGVSTE